MLWPPFRTRLMMIGWSFLESPAMGGSLLFGPARGRGQRAADFLHVPRREPGYWLSAPPNTYGNRLPATHARTERLALIRATERCRIGTCLLYTSDAADERSSVD